jgi:hypothetical protein
VTKKILTKRKKELRMQEKWSTILLVMPKAVGDVVSEMAVAQTLMRKSETCVKDNLTTATMVAKAWKKNEYEPKKDYK